MLCWNQTQVKHCHNLWETLENLTSFNSKSWIVAQISLSQSSWLMSNLACSGQLWSRVSFSKMMPSLIFIVVSLSWEKFFVFTFHSEDKFSRAQIQIKDAMMCWGSELQRKIGSSTRFEEMDRDVGTCFPIQIVVFVSPKVAFWTKIYSKSNIAK